MIAVGLLKAVALMMVALVGVAAVVEVVIAVGQVEAPSVAPVMAVCAGESAVLPSVVVRQLLVLAQHPPVLHPRQEPVRIA